MTATVAARGALVGVVVLALLAPAWAASASSAGEGDGTDISVTIVDPTASPTPTPTSSAPPGSGSGSGSGSGGSGAGSGADGGEAPVDGGADPDAEGTGGSWIVLSGLENSVQGELDPLRGRVHTRVSIANRSETETVSGELVFRLRTPFGVQIGPAVTRQVDGIEPGGTHAASVDLFGVGQWPLVQSSVTFRPDGADDQEPITRDAWVIAFPWLLLAIVVVVVAAAIVLWLRRDALAARFAPRGAT